MDLVLRDTLSGRPRAVRRRAGRPLALYVCGPTVYDAAHVGHARNYLFFDVARRFLESEGRAVRHVMNITDFEDKLDARAELLGIPWRALARREERRFVRDLAALGALRPHACPRATAFVPEMRKVARQLERTGRVRRVGDEWVYRPPERPLGANFPTDRELATHAVVEPGHPFPHQRGEAGEFVIWKLQDRPKPSWSGPWGRGVPGWHLECYAMADRLLGLPVDLHGGGPDLIYPHHYSENETSLALRGTPFSRVYFHPAFVLVGGAKMSKSTGNLLPLRNALDAVGAGAVRWYLLSSPPGQRLQWEAAGLGRATREFADIRGAVGGALAAGTRGTARSPARLAEAVRRELARGLATDRAFDRIREWATAAQDGPAPRPGARDSTRVRDAFRSIERRTGLPLL
ncbi:MAG: class I tRNA ligase family protein [Thermoplasmata archaeon]